MHSQSPTHSPKLARALFENTSIAVAAAALGLMAGFFWTYSYNVNQAMLQVDGATYATVQSLFNRHVRHAAFFALFFGGALLPLLAALANLRHWRAPTFWLLLAAALVYGLGIVVFTREVNLPLNAYTESWRPDQLPSDWSLIRAQWNAANDTRVWMACTAFVMSLSALVLRASGVGVGARTGSEHRHRHAAATA